MGSHQLQSMIQMINQIAANKAFVGDEQEAIAATTDHVRKFWSRAMKQQIVDYNAHDGEGLCELARKALAQL